MQSKTTALSKLDFGIDRHEFTADIVNCHLRINAALGIVDEVTNNWLSPARFGEPIRHNHLVIRQFSEQEPMMWPFIDPIECRQAEQYLAHGQPLEAARILLAAKASEHKAVREWLLRAGPPLIEQAKQSLAAGDLLVAAEFLACAGKCMELPVDVRALYDQVSCQLHERCAHRL